MTDSLISFRAVNVRRGKRLVLRDLSFDISAGEHLILQGENGIGKTTLLKTALGFILPEKGSLIRKLRGPGSLAYLPQESLSGDLPISVQEVVDIGFSARRMGRTERRRRIHDLLEALGCASLAGRSFATLLGGRETAGLPGTLSCPGPGNAHPGRTHRRAGSGDPVPFLSPPSGDGCRTWSRSAAGNPRPQGNPRGRLASTASRAGAGYHPCAGGGLMLEYLALPPIQRGIPGPPDCGNRLSTDRGFRNQAEPHNPALHADARGPSGKRPGHGDFRYLRFWAVW